jgi:hypothetical protein
VPEVICPTAHRLIHLLNKLRRRNCRPPLGEVLNPPSDIALRRLTGKDVDARLTAFGRATLHELEPDEEKLGMRKRIEIAGKICGTVKNEATPISMSALTRSPPESEDVQASTPVTKFM